MDRISLMKHLEDDHGLDPMPLIELSDDAIIQRHLDEPHPGNPLPYDDSLPGVS